MFSKTESKKIREEFWTTFGKKHPRKWLLYNTKIKDVNLKFTFTTKNAQVSLDIEHQDSKLRANHFNKIIALKSILTNEYIEGILFDEMFELENRKTISRIYIKKSNVSIHNKDDWDKTMLFLTKYMDKLEEFFIEYQDYISQ